MQVTKNQSRRVAGYKVTKSLGHDPFAITEDKCLTPAMRERLLAFYEKVDLDLFESEHQAHMKLCRDLAEAARKRGEDDKARKIERKARAWAERHYAAFAAESRKGVAR